MKRITLLILLTSLCINLVFAQKRTTSVKGYYRKDGTYVSPHTRGYTAGSGSTYTSSFSSDKDETSPSDIAPTILKLIRINQGSSKDLRSSEYYNVQGQKVLATKLNFVVQDSISKQTANEEKTSGGVVFYVSVLRYNGKTIDVCPVARSIFSGWDFDKVSHRFQKKDITTEDALDLVSNYGWRISNDEISKDFSYSYSNKGFPKYLTKTIEAINVE